MPSAPLTHWTVTSVGGSAPDSLAMEANKPTLQYYFVALPLLSVLLGRTAYHFDVAAMVEHQILRFEVAVDDRPTV